MDPPTKKLPNQDSWDDITCQSPSSKHYHFKRQGYVGQSVLSALSHNIMIQYTCKRKAVKVYLWNAIVTKHLSLTIWHSNIYWNDNVYWMVIDKWCHLKNLGLEDILRADPSTIVIQALLDKSILKREIIMIWGCLYNNYVHFWVAHLIYRLHKESSNFHLVYDVFKFYLIQQGNERSSFNLVSHFLCFTTPPPFFFLDS